MSFQFDKNRSNLISRRLLVWVLIVSSIVTMVLTGLQLGFEYFQDLADLENNLHLVEDVSAKVLLIFITQFLKTLIASFGTYFVIQRLLTRPLVDAINDLQAKLQQSYLELSQIKQHLEEKVADKTAQIIDQRQKIEYATKMSFLGEMAGGIAHEINAPISNLRGNIDLLLKTLEKSDFQKNVFRNVLLANQATVERVAKIIQGLRTFSRDGSHDPFLPTPVNAIIHGATSLCREKFKNSSVDLRISQLPPDLVINCRSTEIRQVLLNLLNNSFDAVQKLPHKWIQIDFAVTDSDYRLSVTDSGAGLPIEIQERMFQPFFSTKDLGKGTGLGLSVSQGVIENHGGSLVFDNSSKNTRFVIILPRQLKIQ
jgi:C4-dicarboxylate-specific signal transduction histidine kinase